MNLASDVAWHPHDTAAAARINGTAAGGRTPGRLLLVCAAIFDKQHHLLYLHYLYSRITYKLSTQIFKHRHHHHHHHHHHGHQLQQFKLYADVAQAVSARG